MNSTVQIKIILLANRYPDLAIEIFLKLFPVCTQVKRNIIVLPVFKDLFVHFAGHRVANGLRISISTLAAKHSIKSMHLFTAINYVFHLTVLLHGYPGKYSGNSSDHSQ